ncbi:MAG: SCO family protein [Neoaquamicrobium sediminum]|uniref:SCO family protein n=1 Tax=Neoaquamicrobium sediminum TaxID=1849104 RepID=UPI004035B6CC
MAGMAAMAADPGLRGLGLAIVGLAVCAVVLVLTASWALFRPGGPVGEEGEHVIQIGGPFELVAHKGERVSDDDLAGRPFAVFFGFTHCPEVCPITLWERSEALNELGSDAERLKVLFISVDPKRDTPEFLASYLQSFDPRIVDLTGSEQAIEAVGQAYRDYGRRIDIEDGDYTMEHTASVDLMDADGQFVGTISYSEDQASRMEKLRRLLAGASA